jgi:osmotically-inducible protein OsmY
MKTDSKLQHDVMAELAWDPSIDHADIGVAVNDGVVSLSGQVKSYAEKLAAEAAAKRVQGVHAIAEEIKVQYPSATISTDSQIAKRIVDMFAWDMTIPDDKITVKVEKGWVTLSGIVDWNFQSQAAKATASRVHGVLGVSLELKIRNSATAQDVRERIEAALKRSAVVDAAKITVAADGDEITLGGKVHDWHERQTASRAAWAAPGVYRVVDNIVLA